MRIDSILPVARQRMITVQAGASLVDAAHLLSDTHRALLVVCNDDGAMVGGNHKNRRGATGRSMSRRRRKQAHFRGDDTNGDLLPN